MFDVNSFDDMQYNPLKGMDQPITLVYPRLARHGILTEFRKIEFRDLKTKTTVNWTKKDFDLLIRFCLLTCVRKNNPLAEESDIKVMFQIAYDLLGINAERDTVPAMVNSLHTLYTKICSTCFILGSDMLYQQWSSMRMVWQNLNQQLTSNSLEAADVIRVSRSLTELRREIMTIETSLFPSTYHADIAVEEESIRLYAEMNAIEWE